MKLKFVFGDIHGMLDMFTEKSYPDILDNRCNLDTGSCFKDGKITCAVFDEDNIQPIQIIQSRI